jgi:class 3 adenylate cyclase/tetratricopeptide (TPR) repeat protein
MKCHKCQTELSDEANFCEKCGQNLGVKKQPSKSSYNPDAERKRVTALFSDLSGYTAMTGKLDPEEVKEITSSIFNGIREVVYKYEGFIERFAGDGVLALFGVPRAHEDDPIRAVRAAKEIHKFVEALSPHYEIKVGRTLLMHSGINTGLSVTADVDVEKGTHGVTGDAINVAARLSDLAAAGTILVGPETYTTAKHHFIFEVQEYTKIKGKTESIPIYKLLSANTLVSQKSVSRKISSDMVGRDKELDRLELQVLKAVNGEGSVVNIIGEAGIGKSRLIAELKNREVMKRVTILEGRAISFGKNLSFHPVIDLLKHWAGISDDGSTANALNKLKLAIQAVHPKDADEIFPFVATLMGIKLQGRYAERVKGIEGESLEKLIFKNVRELIIKGSEVRPTIMIIEDLHWADTSSIELLEVLYQLAENNKLVFINVFRPGYLDDDEDVKVATTGEGHPTYYVEIKIPPLKKNDSETLIQNMLKIKGLPYSVRNRIIHRTGGNPFFIEEVVRSLIDEGAIVRRNGGFELSEKIDGLVIPSTINDVLIARIDRLEEQTKELVKIASVIGRSFFDKILKDVANSIGNVDSRLSYLKDVQLIRDRMRMQELEYLFKHALAQEAAYESTLLEQRKVLHLRVAKSIERVFKKNLHTFYGMLAYHYSKGGDLDSAEKNMLRAGEEALQSSASSEALKYFQEALKLYEERSGSNPNLEKLTLLKSNLATAHFNRGHMSEAVEYFDEILINKGYRSPNKKLLLIVRAIFDFLAIVTFFYLPLKRKKRNPNEQELKDLRLLFGRCQSLFLVDSKRFFLESLSVTRIICKLDLHLIPQGIKYAASSAGIFYLPGLSYSIADKALQRAEKIADAQNRPDAIDVLFHRSGHALFTGQWKSAPYFDTSLLERELRKGEFFGSIFLLSIQCQIKLEQGNFHEAKLLTDSLQQIAESYNYEDAKAANYFVSALAAIKKGTFNEASIEAEKGILQMDRMTQIPRKVAFIGFKGIAETHQGKLKTALSTISAGEVLIATQRTITPIYAVPFLLCKMLINLHLLVDAIEKKNHVHILKYKKAAHKCAKMAVRGSKKYAPYRTWILRLMGEYYWLIDKQGKALKWWDKSIKEGERLGARPDLSRTYFVVGRRLIEPHSKYNKLNEIKAKDYLEKARTMFEEMDLQRDQDELDKIASDS